MTSLDRTGLLERMDETRQQLEELLPACTPGRELYPGWTIRELLAHLTGWEDALVDTLRAHAAGRTPPTPALDGIDAYNARAVGARAGMDLPHILQEWQLTRRILRTLVDALPEHEFHLPFTTPWGTRGTVVSVLEIILTHEEEHTGEVRRWLRQPRTLTKKESR